MENYLPPWRKSMSLLMAFMCFSLFAWSQDKTIRGTVTDGETGDALPGVNVLVKGTTTGTITNVEGQFTLSVPSGAQTIVFSSVGYTSDEVDINNRTTIDMALMPDIQSLSEVVVVGYGTQEKRDVTAAIASLDEEAIKQIPTANPLESMKGQVAGVDIVSAGGRPGQYPSVTIRGRRSLTASNEPLFVVDGVPMTSGTGTIYDFNPQDIESMEVLKDAAATAIYGSRGANGVILVTTKRGKAGKTVVSYDGYYGVSNALNQVDMMNGAEFAEMKRESRRIDEDGNTGRQAWGPGSSLQSDEIVFEDPAELESIAIGRSTDYQDLVINSGFQTNHQLSVAGGNEKTQFNVSLGYFKEQGIIENQDYQRFTGRLNIDHNISDRFKVGMSSFLSTSTQNWGSNATLSEAINNNPLGQPYNEDGTPKFLPIADGIRTNPLNELVPGAYVDERDFTRIFTSMYFQANIIEGLQYKLLFGPDIRYRRQGVFQGSLTNARRGADPAAELENEKVFGYTLENLLTYNTSIGENHDFTFTFLQSIQESKDENHFNRVVNLPYETQLWYNIGTAGTIESISSRLEEWQLASYMGRINYSIADKYLFQFTYRADGSSRLAPGNKWAYFPGISAGWRVIDEPFMSGASNWLTELKLRASYGEVGNTSVDPYQTAGRLARTVYDWNDANAAGFRLNEIPNADLGWEISKTIDVGADFGFFNNRLSGSFDYYVTNTENLLLERRLPSTSGYDQILQNIGSTQTRGVELQVGAFIIDSQEQGGFRWNLNMNVTHYEEEITELALTDENGNPIDDIGNEWFIGEPIRVFFDYKKTGIWQADEADLAEQMDGAFPGEIKVADMNGDGIISPEDRTILGSDVPDVLGGINNRFEFKGFDLSVFLYYRLGHMINSNFNVGQVTMQGRYNNLDVDYWTPTNPTNAYPRPNINQERPQKVSTLGYFDGSYLKLRNVTLGYNFNQGITERLGLSSLRVYTTAQNPMYWAKYETYDPENNNDIGTGDVPSTSLYLLGINFQF
ncbi:TonB-linked SusC/RagA family outer membrane protein [Catalinimonas alkaloidigena]|uniref:SusC/RagA family TonB-linked outer membrane protein n=1 Tax=Catalinimonas alkaloidigena TaxID=1075417 RepID=UPI002406E02F|nr:TonB-dependent receptor [Catalinimonas alkaloidigena]MDF9796050.1 TonB-linked SusC/RagA family outer membrane protein [Catalinimonas alkaloidigena]